MLDVSFETLYFQAASRRRGASKPPVDSIATCVMRSPAFVVGEILAGK